MFCTNCGKKISANSSFCVECGESTIKNEGKHLPVSADDNKWWIRLAKVTYIGLYVPLPFVLVGVWTVNDPYSYYDSYSKTFHQYGSYGEAFWYSLLTLVIWVVVLRLMKVAFLYVFLAQNPQWKKEFKRWF